MYNFLMASIIATFGQNAPRYDWWCSLSVNLQGRPNHFFYTGRDAWEAEPNSEILCISNTATVKRKIEVNFESLKKGYGVYGDSKLRLTLTLWSRSTDFRFLGIINGQTDNSNLVHWQFHSEDFDLIGSVWFGTQFSAADSLTLGTLSLQPKD